MTEQEIALKKHFAKAQVETFTELATALQVAENLIAANRSKDELLVNYSEGINQAQATIASKDAQLNQALAEVERLQSIIDNYNAPTSGVPFPDAPQTNMPDFDHGIIDQPDFPYPDEENH